VKGFLDPRVYDAIGSLLRACHMLWQKEMHRGSIPVLRALVAEAVCKVEAYLPFTERDIKLHLLLMLVDNIALWGELLGGEGRVGLGVERV
jgi:hypothetical protein